VADQATKAWLVETVAPGEQLRVVGDLLRFVHHQNTGALFGLFPDSAPLFGAVSVVVVGLIVAFHARSGRNTPITISLGLLLGGALGNMADRFARGHVVDFVDAGIGDLRFWTFNVADSAVTIAILVLLATAFLPLQRPRPHPRGAPDAAGTPGATP
jgi:signal peptidase II